MSRQVKALSKLHYRRHSLRTRNPFSSNVTQQQVGPTTNGIPIPTSDQLRAHYISNGLPMVGFGLMDQTVMIQAGNAIDCTLGVKLGLSTLSAAAVGGLVSNVSGIIFGGTLESLATRAGLPSSNLTAQQRTLFFVKRNRLVAQAFGVLIGCTMGLVNLLFIDTDRSTSLKLKHIADENEFAYEVECYNDNPNSTTFIVKGPDNDGLLAGMTAALTLSGFSILDVSAHKLPDGTIEDKFAVVNQATKRRLDDDELDHVSQLLLNATKEGPLMLKAQVGELEDQNAQLQERINHLEEVLLKRRMTIRRSHVALKSNDC